MKKIVSINISIVLLIIIIILMFAVNLSSHSICGECLLLVAIAFIIYFSNQQGSQLRGWWIRPSNIFLFGLLIVNLQYIIDFTLGYKTISNFVSLWSLNYCAAIGSAGIISFIIGNLTSKTIRQQASFAPNNTSGCFFLYLIQAVSFIGWILSVDLISLITGATYGDGTWKWDGGLSTLLEGLIYASTITILVFKIIKSSDDEPKNLRSFIKSFSFSFWLFVTLYLTIRILSGDRGPFIYTTLSIFFSYIIISKRKIAFQYVLAGVVIFAVFLILIGIARTQSATLSVSEKLSIALQSYDKARFSDATVFVPTEELAYSFRCNETAVNEIKNGAKFHYGKYQLFALLNCIPFMPSFMYNKLKIPITELSSDYYLTEAYFGDYSISGQIGTTVVADFFLDFGLLGVIVGMFLVGLFFKQVDNNICISNSSSLSVIAVIITLAFASKAIYIPRATFLGQLKPTVIILVLFYLNKLISSK